MNRVLLICAFALRALAQDDPSYTETMDVVRYLVDVRALDADNRAVTDLTAADFTVTIAGKPAEVESAQWIGSAPDARPTDPNDPAPPPAGRLLVLFLHTDFARNPTRVLGHLRFAPLADHILSLLEAGDRVAVLQHDSHLVMRLDFSSDHDAIRTAVADSLRTRVAPLPSATGLLAKHLSAEAMKRSATVDSSLLLVAEALRAIDGSKALLLAGWGIGELQDGRVVLSKEWRKAVTVFRRDKVPIITIGTGLGAQLTYGLVASSQVTGGVYAGSTQSFPQQTAIRVTGALAGYYELVLRASQPLPPGDHRIAVRTARRSITIFAPPSLIVEKTSTEEVAFVPEQPTNTDALTLFTSAMTRLRDGDADGVENMLTEVIAIDPSFAPAWYERGMLAAGRGETDAAHADLRKYLELDPHGAHARDAREILRRAKPLHYRP